MSRRCLGGVQEVSTKCHLRLALVELELEAEHVRQVLREEERNSLIIDQLIN